MQRLLPEEGAAFNPTAEFRGEIQAKYPLPDLPLKPILKVTRGIQRAQKSRVSLVNLLAGPKKE